MASYTEHEKFGLYMPNKMSLVDVPWKNWTEWLEVFHSITSLENLESAILTLEIWKSRGGVPPSIECTHLFLKTMLWEENSPSCMYLSSALAVAIVRFVNLMMDEREERLTKLPMKLRCARLSIPLELIQTRHNICHGEFPGISVLRRSMIMSFEYLVKGYWETQAAHIKKAMALAPSDYTQTMKSLITRTVALTNGWVKNVNLDPIPVHEHTLEEALDTDDETTGTWRKRKSPTDGGRNLRELRKKHKIQTPGSLKKVQFHMFSDSSKMVDFSILNDPSKKEELCFLVNNTPYLLEYLKDHLFAFQPSQKKSLSFFLDFYMLSFDPNRSPLPCVIIILSYLCNCSLREFNEFFFLLISRLIRPIQCLDREFAKWSDILDCNYIERKKMTNNFSTENVQGRYTKWLQLFVFDNENPSSALLFVLGSLDNKQIETLLRICDVVESRLRKFLPTTVCRTMSSLENLPSEYESVYHLELLALLEKLAAM
eukprot:GHVP01053270.1.p1 GENE.GHVP01053270.1~~GHVP01053270.1.p1  ORF type:complete len:486 (-),score=70.27 GHVP01053270.1:502-1959(-)